MTTTLVIEADAALADLLNTAVYDTGFAVGTVEPGAPRGRGLPSMLAQLLLACGRAQPSNTPIRRVTRADIGRITVAARAAQRDLVIFGSHQLAIADITLLHRAAHRAEVDLWLVADKPWPRDIVTWAQGRTPLVGADEVLTGWAGRAGAQQRRIVWPCDTYLQNGPTSRVNCARHRDVVDCVLEWFPHAVVTARTTPARVRACLFELTMLYPQSKWRVWARARDHYPGLMRAVATWGVNSSDLATVKLSALDSTASTLNLDAGVFMIPETQRDLVAAHRDVLVADGFTPNDLLLQVSAARALQYAMLRRGDPTPLAA